ncbi:hypothetical protein DT019_02990 [Streptomyces sp. SDr-06]|uniref:hypothetical protein n=1 Tax=Streptomyces sp. SDr-06 TaxID=2267702 RepID=UPI000DE9CB79|nr:hypothetical protein [Streptomyces sp. SDr-06]RCH70469.1 hypothetical protein DT019_02990 [Streptomyces sp. SDr-06]
MTDWEKQLNRRATTIDKAELARDNDIAAARLDGHSFRELGKWTRINHESARKICLRINGHTQTRKEREAGSK